MPQIENPLKNEPEKGRFRIIERTAQRQAVLADCVKIYFNPKNALQHSYN